MEVTLLVYDLSRGLARQMSMGFLGFQLDAVYHTSIEVNGREYVYDGGIVAIVPGSSHLGQPMERIRLGVTGLGMDVIEEYLESIRPIYTAEAYDLFKHNCNNFSDAFANFLVGSGIPKHIASMPQAVLESPMGRMLVPQLMQSANAGRQQNGGSLLGLGQSAQTAAPTPTDTGTGAGTVHDVSAPAELARLLDAAKTSCAAVFFTSATCAPCKALYPVYDALARELQGQITLVKVDVARPQAQPIAAQYAVRATPTIVTFLRGAKHSEWAGADAARLRSDLQLLAATAQGPRHLHLHLHEKLRLPSFAQRAGAPPPKPVLYAKVPPLDKLAAKMGAAVAAQPDVQELHAYLAARSTASASASSLGSVAVPDLHSLAALVQRSVAAMPPDALFAVVDMVRCSLADARISAFFAEAPGRAAARAVVARAVDLGEACPYALRLVTLQAACNLFSTPLFGGDALAGDAALRALLVQLVSSSFLDDSHTSVRVAAASLLFNVSLAHQHARRAGSTLQVQVLSDEDQVELAAAVVEAIGQEAASADALRGMLLALGHLVYCAPLDGEVADLLRALDAAGTIRAKKAVFPQEALVDEVGAELLGAGLRRE